MNNETGFVKPYCEDVNTRLPVMTPMADISGEKGKSPTDHKAVIAKTQYEYICQIGTFIITDISLSYKS
jgi:hypothetical protein